MTKSKKPHGLSSMKMDCYTESYLSNRTGAGQPLELSISFNLPGRRGVSEEWHRACDAQMKWERAGNPGKYNNGDYEAAHEIEDKAVRAHYTAEGKKATEAIAPLVQALGGVIVSDHIIDLADGQPYYGAIRVTMPSIDAVKKLVASDSVEEVILDSPKAQMRRNREFLRSFFRPAAPFRSRFATAEAA